MTESLTRAAPKTAAKTGTAAKKTSSSAKKASSSAKKKPAASTSSAVKLSTAERALIRNYRKCSAAEKKIVDAVAEKLSGDIDVGGILSILKEYALK